MTEPKKICTVHLGSSVRISDYTFYEDGRVNHYYDRSNAYSRDEESWHEAGTLRDEIKQKLLDKCPEELKEKVKELLYP